MSQLLCSGSVRGRSRARGMLAAFVLLAPASFGQVQAFRVDRLWPGDGEPIDDAILLIEGDEVLALGPASSTPIPEDAVVHDLVGRDIVPGLVVAQSQLAQSSDTELSLTPQMSALAGFDFFETHEDALAAGVTTVQLSPGAQRLMPGAGAVVKLSGRDRARRTLSDRESLRVVLAEEAREPPTVFRPPVGAVSIDRPLTPTFHQLSTSLAGSIGGLDLLFRAARLFEGDASVEPETAALQDHLSSGRPLRITARSREEIRLALRLAAQFEQRVLLVEPDALPEDEDWEAWTAQVDGVVLRARGPEELREDGRADEGPEAWEAAAELIAAGLRVAICPPDDDSLEHLRFLGARCLRGGIEPWQALAAISSWPAEMMGVHEQVGSLAPGRHADFVVLDGDPFALRTKVESTWVDGARVHEAASGGPTTILRAGLVYTGDGGILEGADLVVKGRTIRGVGEVSAPEDAIVLDYRHAVIVPGFIDLGSGLRSGRGGGGSGPAGGAAGRGFGGGAFGGGEASTEEDGDEAEPEESDEALARRGGITTALIPASGGGNPSALQAIKLGDDGRVISDPVALSFRFGDDVDTWGPRLAEDLQEASDYHEAWSRYEVENVSYRKARVEQMKRIMAGEEDDPEELVKPDKPEEDESLETYRALFMGRIPAFVEARRSDAIRAVVEAFAPHPQVRVILTGLDDLARFPDLLDGAKVLACAGPELQIERDRRTTNLPQLLANEGVPFGFRSSAGRGARDFADRVQYAVSRGLSPRDALVGLTGGAAELLSSQAPIGRLEPGRDADLVVLSGEPFEFATRVLAVMIDGEWVHREEEE